MPRPRIHPPRTLRGREARRHQAHRGRPPAAGEIPLPALRGQPRGRAALERQVPRVENEWQSFRTRKSRELELVTAPHTYDKPGRYTVAVKVIDIFGNDTMALVPVDVS